MQKSTAKDVEKCIKNFNENKGHPIKILLKLHSGEGLQLFASLLMDILKVMPSWVIPVVTANIIDIATYTDQHSLSEIWINAAILALCLLQNIFSTYGLSVVYDRLVRKIEFTLRGCLVEKLQQLSIMYHKNTSSGKLQSKIMRDCENIVVMLEGMFRGLTECLLSFTVVITITLYRCPMVMLFFLAVIPVEMIMMKVFRHCIKKSNYRYRSEVETAQSNVSEMLELIPVTRAHGIQQREIRKMENKFETVKNAGYSLDKINSFFGACLWVVMQMANLTCLVFMGYMAYRKKITVGECVLYQTYFGQIVGYVNTLLNIYPTLSKGNESINSIAEVICEEKVEVNNSILPLEKMKGKVVFRDVCYKYDDSPTLVLNNFSLEVNRGESVAFVGGSGAGKSTILNLLIGYDKPCEGKILIDGINMENLDLNEFRSNIAVVPQNTVLFSGTVRDNITYGIDGVTDEMLWNVLCDVGLDDVVKSLPNGIETYLGEHGGNLSGGQRQRISIARALLRKPKLIIFDEATSALDSASEKKVQAAVDNMMKHCTTFLVAHRLSTVRNADRIAVIERGSIVEIGSYDELMEKKGAFWQLKMLQE